MSKPNMKKMMRDYPDVLQNIEFTLVSGYRQDRGIDDRMALTALQCILHDNVPDDLPTITLAENLVDAEEMRPDVPKQIWNEGLRVVMESVRTHSTLKQGATEYLDFVSQFIE